MVGFEPTTSRFQSEPSARLSLHSDGTLGKIRTYTVRDFKSLASAKFGLQGLSNIGSHPQIRTEIHLFLRQIGMPIFPSDGLGGYDRTLTCVTRIAS